MARKPPIPKPMSRLRGDFFVSLENVCQQSLMMLQAVEMVIKHEGLPEPMRKILKERSDAVRDALVGNYDDDN